MEKFEQFRKKYREFYYNGYSVEEDNEKIALIYDFEIPGLKTFRPRVEILKKKMALKPTDSVAVRNMAFQIGMVELIGYWKAVCAPKIIVKCGKLEPEQIEWWKKLYFYGLGELFYRNGIKTNVDKFVTIESTGEAIRYERIEDAAEGYIVPIGGGKDSVVTLETLKLDREKDYALIVNPKKTTLECARIAGFSDDNIIEVRRTIDPGLIELNKEGFINGHTPFSAMLAFLSYFIAYLTSKKYVALSNESSANESNIEDVNHQYSKSFEFEEDFRAYAEKYLKAPVEYFSFLRPLNELQIAKIFATKKAYHKVFKSCNVGSKEAEWKWCNACAKCLFAYIILSPYLYKDELVEIFQEDLFEKESLLTIFLELTGNGETKPFDCVGTFEEVNFAIRKTIEKIDGELPYLLEYYQKHFGGEAGEDITKRYNTENNLTKEQNNLLKGALSD